MAGYAGYAGSLTCVDLSGPGAASSGAKGWAVDTVADALDTSVLGTQARSFIAGPTSWTGTINLMYDPANTMVAGATATFTGTMISGDTVAGSCVVTGVGYAVDYNDLVLQPVTFQGSGALTLTQ